MTAAVPDEAMAPVIGRTTLGRYGEAPEVAEAVVWLAPPPPPTSTAPCCPSTAATSPPDPRIREEEFT